MDYYIVVPTCKPMEAVQPLLIEIRKAEPFVPVLATCCTGSAAFNRNLALDMADAPVVVQVDDDVYGFEDFFADRLVKTLKATPHAVMVSARLLDANGRYGPMCGGVNMAPSQRGIVAATKRYLPTACVAFYRTDLRFDEVYKGSGWEDQDMARQILVRNPRGQFYVDNDILVVHRNEMKEQRVHWQANRQYFLRKWVQNARA